MVKKVLIVVVVVTVTCICVSSGSPVTDAAPLNNEEDDDEEETNSTDTVTNDLELEGNTKSGFDSTSTTYLNINRSTDEPITDISTSPYKSDARSFWTDWFNTDNPASGKGDLESSSFIADRMAISICPKGTEIVDGDCRTAETHEGPPFLDDNLLQPCGKYGLLCLNEHQVARNCSDFEVRFKCQVIDDSRLPVLPGKDKEKKFYTFDVRIYIVLAVIPISIFVIRVCWTFTWDRRHRRFIRRDSGVVRRHSEVSVNSALFRPPPSYCELFGQNGSSYTMSRNYKLCEVCSTSSCSLYLTSSDSVVTGNRSVSQISPTGNAPSNNSRNSSGDNINYQNSLERAVPLIKSLSSTCSDNDENTERGSNNPTIEFTGGPTRDSDSVSVSVCHGTTTRDPESVSMPISDETTRDQDSVGVSVSNAEPGVNPVPNPDSQFVTLRIDPSDELRVGNSGTSVLIVPESGGDDHVTSEQCACPCHKSTRDEPNYDNLAFVHDNETNNDMARRMPGMHVPVFGTSTELPPPSYREALELLKQNKPVSC
ncbi:uncharacterized protein LOC121375789 [Gigantopelta aegis]|uniref:uncharacterized protein LOC121375789 n=1 Tax=Gigantopelta aegis TaxID=1735272 RepID=UPI001B88D1D1|nr:uncharacterized protein LOC121375789 [Gigantopelta aegis]